MNFVAVDVETANSKLSSICQIGIAEFQSGTLTHKWQSLVHPEDDFDGINAGGPAFRAFCERVGCRNANTIRF